MVVGSSFNEYDSTFTSDSGFKRSAEEDYIDQLSNVDGIADKGSHNPSLNPQQAGPDSQFDTLTESTAWTANTHASSQRLQELQLS